jgi:diguanylate cyclase (GGDEF)-like protein
MKSHNSHASHGMSTRYADWWPPLLILILLVSSWVAVLRRGDDDDARVIRDALIAHGNVAHALASHSERMLGRLRFYGQTLVGPVPYESATTLVRSALMQDRAFLRLMHFDAAGRLLFSSGRKPEPWLLDKAREFTLDSGSDQKLVIGTIAPNEFARAWSLPIFYRPPPQEGQRGGFVIALADIGDFPRNFQEISLGKSGEIVLVSDDGRELLHMHEGRLDPLQSLAGTERFRQAFASESGTLSESTNGAQGRLYAYRHVPASPLAVLVSRSSYEVLLENQAAQRGYWGTQLLVTLLMLFLTLLWMIVAHRRRQLVSRLSWTQANNARLIDQIGDEKEEAYRLATHDNLTGLPNRTLFAEVANRYISRAQRQRGRFAVMFVDLDRFKPINDSYGHKAGDQVLIEVARRLCECMRQSDVVSRHGGDEFVALVSDLRAGQDASGVAEKIIESLSRPLCGIVGTDLKLTPSIGISFYPDDADSIDSLVRQADAAMYQAKGNGRATFAFADPDMNRKNRLINQIEAALPAALQDGEISVHYQPKVSLADFSITGLEALARWTHPELGPISPVDFIPVAEECGAIVELGEYVIAAVCQQLAAWARAGVPLVPVAVNVSAHQLRSPQLYDFIAGALAEHGIAPHFLEIEITETGLIDADGFIDTLRRLDDLGIRLAIDDFGTGYSGLSHLRTLPVKYLKIDRSFIKDIRNDCNDAAIVSNTISLSHKLNLQTIAEGVETREQVSHLKAARCDQAQGYFFSRPCDPPAVELLLRQGHIYADMSEEGA